MTPWRGIPSVIVLSLVASLSGIAADTPLEFSRLDLTDGRKLKNVVVKTYDPATNKILLIADGKAMTVPLALVPPPFNEQLRQARRSGESVSAYSTPPPPAAPMATAADQYELPTAVPTPRPAPVAAPTTPAPRVTSPIRPPTSSARPATPNQAVAHQVGINLNAHKTVVLKRAQSYYRYEFRVGSDAAALTGLDLEVSTPKVVPGWEGRCRTEGKAMLEIFDSRGRSFQRRTSTFEVITEKKTGDDEIVVIEFTPKT